MIYVSYFYEETGIQTYSPSPRVLPDLSYKTDISRSVSENQSPRDRELAPPTGLGKVHLIWVLKEEKDFFRKIEGWRRGWGGGGGEKENSRCKCPELQEGLYL